VKVGDLVKMPGCMPDQGVEIIGVVTRTKPDGINRGTPRIQRVQIYWIPDKEYAWEPAKWLEVISASR
jgi:hypothetical protein